MPVVGMRRTTKVLGVVKSVDGARVLRSGRRLMPESGYRKLSRTINVDECKLKEKVIVNFKIAPQYDNPVVNSKPETTSLTNVDLPNGVKKEKTAKCEGKRFGIVYSRKRKNIALENSSNSVDMMFGICYARKKMKIKKKNKNKWEINGMLGLEVLNIIVEGGYRNEFASFLCIILSYISTVRLRILEIASLLISEPVTSLFASRGIHFSMGTVTDRTGICKIFGGSQFVPLFSVDFSAIPSCFMYIHFCFVLRVESMFLAPLINWFIADAIVVDHVPRKTITDQSRKMKKTKWVDLESADNSSESRWVLAGKNTHGIRRRRSTIRRSARNPSLLWEEHPMSMKNSLAPSSMASKSLKNRHRNRTRMSNLKNQKAATSEIESHDCCCSCMANILITESDRCYRIEKVMIMLEVCNTGEWLLVGKKDGLTKCTHLAQKNMKHSSSNRTTHDVIWAENDHWKLEFPNRHDWFIFKDLYKKCYDRNSSSLSNPIPIPAVFEVLGGYEANSSSVFSMPDAYISSKGDEIVRTMTARSANYDMDSEDEKWLKNHNQDLSLPSEPLSEDTFELMIDALEKGFFSNPDDLGNEQAVSILCAEFGRDKEDDVEAVFCYWMKKRKQKRSALLRVFQVKQLGIIGLIFKVRILIFAFLFMNSCRKIHQRNPLLFLSLFRGRRRANTTKEADNLPCSKRDKIEERKEAAMKAEESKLHAQSLVELAITKRSDAQSIMEGAELLTYKAAMTYKIAEAARVTCSTSEAFTRFLPESMAETL